MADKDNKRLKHPEIRIILFVLAIAVAVTGFTFAIIGWARKGNESGYYLIERKKNEEVPSYGDDLSFYYYLEGSSIEIGTKKSEISTFYSDQLSFYYASLDEADTYEHYPSIALLNKNPNSTVTLSEYAYNTLKNAYDSGITYSNYSIFSEPTYTFWEQMVGRGKEQRVTLDPDNPSSTTDEELVTLASYYKNREHVNVEFYDNYQAKLVISNEYLNYLTELGLNSYVVGLNVMKSSYIMKSIVNYLRQYEYKKGYFVSNDGLVVELDNIPKQLSYNYFDSYVESDQVVNVEAASINLNPYSFAKSNRRFPLNDTDTTYMVKIGDEYKYRSYYYDLDTGIPHQEILSTTIYSASLDDDIITYSYINNELSKFTSVEEITTYLASKSLSNIMLTIGLNDRNKNIYVTESIKNYVSLSQELDYNLIKI